MSVNGIDGRIVSDADMVRLDTQNLPLLGVALVHNLVPLSPAACRQKPKVGKLGGERRRYAA